jgi:hypothetical protein
MNLVAVFNGLLGGRVNLDSGKNNSRDYADYNQDKYADQPKPVHANLKGQYLWFGPEGFPSGPKPVTNLWRFGR